MRGVAIVCLTAGVAACGGSGVDIDVSSPNADIDEVELFVAPGECSRQNGSPCASGIAWSSTLQDQPAGDIFLLQDSNALTAPAKGNAARFRLEASGGNSFVARIAAVGKSQGKVVAGGVLTPDVDIPFDHPEIWKLELEPMSEPPAAGPDATPVPGAPEQRLHVWTAADRDPALADCAMFQSWNGSSWDREYLVPPMDRDCDGNAIECNNYWFDFNAGGDATSCLSTSGTLDNGICTVGSALCADGRSANDECVQSTPEICVADALCASCTTSPSIDGTCLMQQISDSFDNPGMPVVPFADCSFVPDIAMAGAPCTNANSNQITLELSSIGAPCTAVAVLPLQLPLAPPLPQVMAGQATITAHLDQTACIVTLTWGAGAATVTDSTAFLLDVAFPSTKHVLLPLRISFQQPQVCPPVTGTFGCQLLGADTSFNCGK